LHTFEKEAPDLVVLDIRMPRIDGFRVCQQIRERASTPIIMLTAVDSEDDKIRCFDLDADDYITKPFGKKELLARVEAVLRRAEISDECVEPAFHCHELTIDYTGHRVTLGEDELILTATEQRLLTCLARNAGRVLTSGQLLAKVWGEAYLGEIHMLQVNMERLRRKLRDDARNPRFISTRTGIGYMLLKPG